MVLESRVIASSSGIRPTMSTALVCRSALLTAIDSPAWPPAVRYHERALMVPSRPKCELTCSNMLGSSGFQFGWRRRMPCRAASICSGTEMNRRRSWIEVKESIENVNRVNVASVSPVGSLRRRMLDTPSMKAT